MAGIALKFVERYYEAFHEGPEKLQNFFGPSTLIFWTNEGSHDNICHGDSVFDRLESLGYRNTRVDLKHVASINGANDTLIIQVVGWLAKDDEEPRKFSQTLILSRQDRTYCLTHDVLVFLAEDPIEFEMVESFVDTAVSEQPTKQETLPAAPATTAAAPAPAVVKAPVVEAVAAPAVAEPVVVAAAVPEPVVQAAPATAAASAPVVAAAATTTPATAAPVVAAPEPVATPAAATTTAPASKASYAKMADRPAKPSVAPQKAKPVAPAAATTAPATAGAGATGATGASSTGAGATAGAEGSTPNGHADGADKPRRSAGAPNRNPFSVHLSGFSAETTTAEIHSHFVAYGKCSVHIFDKNGFAFVDFTDAESKAKALALGSVVINGNNVTISDRRNGQRTEFRAGSRGFRGQGQNRVSQPRQQQAGTAPQQQQQQQAAVAAPPAAQQQQPQAAAVTAAPQKPVTVVERRRK